MVWRIATLWLSVEHLHIFRDDLGHILFGSALILPGAGLQAAFEENLAAFSQILSGDLCEASPHDDVVKFNGFFFLSGLRVFPNPVRRDREIGN